jgi:hypothetical protein
MPSLWAVLHFDKFATMRLTDGRVLLVPGRKKAAVPCIYDVSAGSRCLQVAAAIFLAAAEGHLRLFYRVFESPL